MSLYAMAETVRAEQRRIIAAAPGARRKNAQYAADQWKEQKRRAWAKARPVFEGAFRREFTPERFTYTRGKRSALDKFTKVAINYEGKLLAFVDIYSAQEGWPRLSVRPIDAPADDTKTIQCNPSALYYELAKLIDKWGLA